MMSLNKDGVFYIENEILNKDFQLPDGTRYVHCYRSDVSKVKFPTLTDFSAVLCVIGKLPVCTQNITINQCSLQEDSTASSNLVMLVNQKNKLVFVEKGCRHLIIDHCEVKQIYTKSDIEYVTIKNSNTKITKVLDSQF